MVRQDADGIHLPYVEMRAKTADRRGDGIFVMPGKLQHSTRPTTRNAQPAALHPRRSLRRYGLASSLKWGQVIDPRYSSHRQQRRKLRPFAGAPRWIGQKNRAAFAHRVSKGRHEPRRIRLPHHDGRFLLFAHPRRRAEQAG